MLEPIEISTTADGSLRVTLRGALVFGQLEPVRDTLREALARLAPSVLVLDLDAVTALDPSGVSMLVAVRRSLRRIGGTCLVERARPAVLTQLRAAGLTQLFGLRAAGRRAPRQRREGPADDASNALRH